MLSRELFKTIATHCAAIGFERLRGLGFYTA
jgi:hypothetical protein